MINIHSTPKVLRIDISGCKNKDKVRQLIAKLSKLTTQSPQKAKGKG